MNEKVRVRLEPIGQEIYVGQNTALKDILSGLGMEYPCGSKGRCGGCKIRLLSGNIPVDPLHQKQLADLKLDPAYRLACKSKITEEVTIEIHQFKDIILSDNSSFEFEPEEGYGIAFDLGTSTLVAQLVNLATGQVEAVNTRINPQIEFGSDLITRVEYAVFKNGQDKLNDAILSAFKEMIEALVQSRQKELNKVVIVGNTVMHHLFGGLELNSLSAYPFETNNLNSLNYTGKDLGLPGIEHCPIVFLPPLGSFVGSDILAGILATSMHKSANHMALIDLGTNGEIAIGNENRILFASTAAGPAFEGTNISCGMRATTGAISSAQDTNEGIRFHVIQNVSPKGICGSGLIDLVSAFIHSGVLDSGGLLTSGEDKIKISDEVSLSQKDVREFQLAKSAISTGLELLSNQLGFEQRELSDIYIAGAFGNFIDLKNAQKIGLLNHSEDRLHKLGNSALLGAKIALFTTKSEMNQIQSISEHVSLERSPDFQDTFAKNLQFERL